MIITHIVELLPMMGIATTAIFFVAILVLSYTLSSVKWRRRSRGLPFPPGPKSLPYIGNIFHMRKPELWKAHKELCKEYGACPLFTCAQTTHTTCR